MKLLTVIFLFFFCHLPGGFGSTLQTLPPNNPGNAVLTTIQTLKFHTEEISSGSEAPAIDLYLNQNFPEFCCLEEADDDDEQQVSRKSEPGPGSSNAVFFNDHSLLKILSFSRYRLLTDSSKYIAQRVLRI